MRDSMLAALTLAALALAWPAAVHAADETEEPDEVILEKPEPSQGHYLGLGLYALVGSAFDENRGLRKPGLGNAFGLRLGQSVTSWADLGIAISGGFTDGDAGDAFAFGSLRAQTQLYPTQHWLVRGGFGPVFVAGTDPEDSDFDRGTYGTVFELGVGRNIFLSDADDSGGWVLTPVLTSEIGPDPEFLTYVIVLGVEISWWSGLSRDQLDLPLDQAYEKEEEEPTEVVEREAKNSIWGELGGPAKRGLYYERTFGDFGARVGFNYGKFRGSGDFLAVPLIVSYLGIGSPTHMLEVGAGGALGYATGDAEIFGVDGEGSGYGGWGTAVIGYRRQPPDGGFNFRLGTAPVITVDGFVPTIYLSLGGTF
jgi:hypothetical protein